MDYTEYYNNDNEPEYYYARFLKAWQNKDWKIMTEYSQITWRENNKDPVNILANMFGYIDIKNILNISRAKNETLNSTVIIDLIAIVECKIAKQQYKYKMMARLIRESGPYVLDETGKWGVNPISALRKV